MIGPLRTRHRHMSTFMLVMAPVLFLLGISSASKWTSQTPHETFIERKPALGFPHQIARFRIPDLHDDMVLTLLADHVLPRNLALRVEIERPLTIPDPLLYWVPGEGMERALLIGPMPTQGVTDILLPHQVKEMYGALVIYSLGHQQEVARYSLSYAGAPQ